MMRNFLFIILLICNVHCLQSRPAQIDSVLHLLSGCWRWKYYYGGFAGLPHTPAWLNAGLKLSQDAQDSSNHTVSYCTYLDSVAADSGRASVLIDSTNSYFPYRLFPDIFAASLGMPDSFWLQFRTLNDTIEFTHYAFADDFIYGFVRDTCLNGSSTPTDTTQYETTDSIIHFLRGCWRLDSYESWGQLFPIGDTTVRLVLSQDAQDSLNHTLTYRCYLDTILIKTDRTSIVPDTNFADNDGYFGSDVLGALIGALYGTIRDEYPTYFRYYDDTLKIWDITITVDAPFYFLVRDSCTIQPVTSYENIDSIIRLLNGCWKWDHYFGGFPGLPPTPSTSNVRLEFSQDAQDSMNHTITCFSYKDSVIYFSDRCSIDDSTALPFYLFGCPLFDGIGIVGPPPVYFYFEEDTLLFPQEQFVDGYVYAFLKKCKPDDTTAVAEYFNDDEIIRIYPNPASGELIISVKDENPFKAKLYSSDGRQVGEFSGVRFAAITVHEFPAGLYFLGIENSKGTIRRAIIIQ